MAETIAAISTPSGEGGIGIVRVSGPASLEIMKRTMYNCPETPEPRHAYFGKVVEDTAKITNIEESDVIDEAVFLYMKGPASYTGEDMLEIQAHGSNVSLRKILESVLSLNIEGVRMAEPGEYTKLAFLNGKMDLAQAEAVIDIITAKTELSLGIAEAQREGRLSENIKNIRQQLLDVLAQMAVDIDYPEEDEDNIGSGASHEVIENLRIVASDIDELVDTIKIGRIARDGIRVVIVGKPNAGKSSLMNALLGEGRVIVTDIPGTTRDTVEETASVNGVPIVLTDTAGVRETDDTVEKIGIEKTRKAISTADIVILVLDGSNDLDEEDDAVIEYLDKMNDDHVIVVINKEDLGVSITEEMVREKLSGAKVIKTSLVGKSALEAASNISSAIGEIYNFGDIYQAENGIITSERHAHLLRKASNDIYDAIGMIENDEPIEVAELSAHYAYDSLGKIIGEDVGDEVLDTVFSRFCLGK